MSLVRRLRLPGGVRLVRRAVTLMVVACVVVSCGAQGSEREAQPGRTVNGSPASPKEDASRSSAGQSAGHPSAGPAGSAAPRPTPKEARGGQLPRVPATHKATELAQQLDRAAATLRDRNATPTDIRRAGEFQQLAIYALATGSAGFRGKVSARLHPETALVTRGAVRAARSLRALGTPQQTLPGWRIVAPPPAAELLDYYQRAQRRTGVPWTYLAAIHLVETRMGRIRGTSTAGARGPMQFLPPTWERYGAGGDINDPRDAILAAARLLKANGAPGDMAKALWHYNPSDHYVRAVSLHARTMQRSASAYYGYWHWQVFYRHARGTYLLPVGYPKARAALLPGKVDNIRKRP